MPSDSSLPSYGESTSGVAADLADLYAKLETTHDESSLLAALFSYVARFYASTADFYRLNVDARGRVNSAELAARFSNGALVPGLPELSPGSDLTAPLWLQNPGEPLLIEDVAGDLRLDEALRQDAASKNIHALAVLPIYSREKKTWQGLLRFFWSAPHSASSEERGTYRLLMRMLSSILECRRTARELAESLDETVQLYEIISRINSAANLDGVLHVAGLGAWASGASQGALLLVEEASPRQPSSVLLAAAISASGQPLKDTFGERMPLADAPLSLLWHGENDEPILIEDVENDARIDGRIKEKFVAAHHHAVALLPLHAGSRVVGALLFFWPERHRFALFDQRLYLAVAKNAAMMLDNRLLIEREKERIRMQEELIRLQAAALAERSTPIIPISNELVVVPLIGSVDSERGNQLMDALLHGVSEHRAKVAIIDITGIRTVDTLAARTLMNAAQALRLLGVETVLTGIRAEVAQTLIQLGIRLDGVVTRNNLQSGIAYALTFTSRKNLEK